MSHSIPKIPDRLRLLDCQGNHVRWIDAFEARALIACGEVNVVGTARKVRAVKWPDREHTSNVVPIRRTRVGQSHRHETEQNVRGVWHIDRVPAHLRGVFTAVLDDCLVEAA